MIAENMRERFSKNDGGQPSKQHSKVSSQPVLIVFLKQPKYLSNSCPHALVGQGQEGLVSVTQH